MFAPGGRKATISNTNVTGGTRFLESAKTRHSTAKGGRKDFLNDLTVAQEVAKVTRFADTSSGVVSPKAGSIPNDQESKRDSIYESVGGETDQVAGPAGGAVGVKRDFLDVI